MSVAKKSEREVAFTVDDIQLVPELGRLRNRNDAVIEPFIYNAPMDTVAGYEFIKAMLKTRHYAVICRFLPEKEWEECVRDFGSDPRTFIATGLITDEYTRTSFMNKVGRLINLREHQINVAIDVAHGDMELAHTTYKAMREEERITHIMSGSICTPDAATRCIDNGCTRLRVGVGGGSPCTTRLMTGVGIPNAYAVNQIFKQVTAPRHNIHVIADGGIRYPGDAVKYLALGAQGVMMGSIFSKTLESPGWVSNANSQLQKSYRGQASKEFQLDQFGVSSRCPEGVSTPLTYQGDTVESVVRMFEGGMSSALSYLGLDRTSKIDPRIVDHVLVTNNGRIEAQPHGLTTSYKVER